MIEPAVGVNPVMPGWPGFVSAFPYGLLSRIAAPTQEPLTVAEMMQQLRLDASNQEPAPSAPTVALAGAGAGLVDNGAHRYGVTFVTADGETQLGSVSAAVTVVDKTTNGQVTVTNVPIGGSAVTARKLYRTTAGGSLYLLLATIPDNATATYTDDLADAALGAQAPAVNTTTDPFVTDLVVTTRQLAEQICQRALLTQTWTLFLDGFPWWRAPIFVPLPPLQEVLSIKYYDQNQVLQTWDPSQYIVVQPAGDVPQRAQIVPASGVSYPLLPSFALTQRRPDGVQVTFMAGWTTPALVPRPIKAAMKLLGGNLYRNREAGQIIRGSADVLPFGVDVLLGPYRDVVY